MANILRLNKNLQKNTVMKRFNWLISVKNTVTEEIQPVAKFRALGDAAIAKNALQKCVGDNPLIYIIDEIKTGKKSIKN